MAKRKSSEPEDSQPARMSDAATNMAVYVAGILAQPESRSHSAYIKLSPSERAILVGLPGLSEVLKERLDIPSRGVKSFEFTLHDLACTCLALAQALLDAEGREIMKLLIVAGKIMEILDRADAGLAKASKTERATPMSKRTTPKSRTAEATGKIYQVKVTLKDIRPPIWRRFQVPDCSLVMLHEIIQLVMGWDDDHLYSFGVGETEYSDPRGSGELDMEDASRVRLSRLITTEAFKFTYTYDFGDNWEHEVLVEKIVPPEAGQLYPVCLKGKRACPPEDVGGAWGYEEFAEAIRDPEHERHEELLEWVGGEFDPEAFDLDAVNKALRRL